MAEREIYNPETGQYELVYDDGIYETNPFAGQPPGPVSMGPPPAGQPPPNAVDPPPGGGGGTTTGGGINWNDPNNPPYDISKHPGYKWVWDAVSGRWSLQPAGGGDTTTGGGTTTNPYEFGGGADWDFDPGSFRFSPFNAPTYAGYQEFQANPFEAPDPAKTADDPWLQFALKQGTNQLNNSAAYQGMLRSGMNNQRILEHGINFTRQFGNDVWNRALQGWQANEDNRFRAWGGNRANSLDTFDRQYRSQFDQFNAQRDAEKMDFNARLQQWRDRLNATTQVATAGMN